MHEIYNKKFNVSPLVSGLCGCDLVQFLDIVNALWVYPIRQYI